MALVVFSWAAYKTLQLISDLGPALIAGAVTIMAAVLTHALTQLREQRQEQQRLKQSNYAELLRIGAKYVRNPAENRDDLDRTQLFSWIIGSAEVIEATQEFTANRDDVALRKLLCTMRSDIGLPKYLTH